MAWKKDLIVLAFQIGSTYGADACNDVCPQGSKCNGAEQGAREATCVANDDHVCTGSGCATGCTQGGECEFVFTKCLNDCWEFNNDELQCEMKKDPENRCYELDCRYDSMGLDFSSDLFGVDNDQSPNPFENQPGEVKFSDGRWRSDCGLGACSMELEMREIDDVEHLIFGFSLETVQSEINVEGQKVFLKNPILKAKVLFECAYRSEVKINSDDFAVHSVTATGEAIEYGNLDEGFEIDIFVDPEMEEPVDEDNVFIGQPIYTRVTWNVPTLKDVTKFLVDDCAIQYKEDQIELIEDNCYATVFGVEQLQESKIVDEKSEFKFNSFIIGAGTKQMTYNLQCSVKMCPLNEEEKCKKQISTKQSDCPSDRTDYQFKPDTFVN